MSEEFKKIFDEATEKGRADKPKNPKLSEIWKLVADKFADKESFKVYDTQHNGHHDITIMSLKEKGRSLSVTQNDNRKIHVNYDRQEDYKEATAEEAIKAFGYFYGRYGKPKL